MEDDPKKIQKWKTISIIFFENWKWKWKTTYNIFLNEEDPPKKFKNEMKTTSKKK
jgi:hypothetical protein